jgi:hypothetical protein
MRRTPSLAIWFGLLMLIAGVLPASAQAAAPTFVYLYDNGAKELLRIYSDGKQEHFPLGLDPSVSLSSFNMAFTPDGSKVAFCVVSYTQGTTQGSATLYLRDIVGQTNSLQRPLGSAVACQTWRQGYNAQAAQIAVSLINYTPGDPSADTSKPIWQLLVIDAVGNQLHELNAQTAVFSAQGITNQQPLLTIVRYFANNQIIFTPVPFATDAGLAAPSYLWQLDANSIQSIANWDKNALDSLSATGELAWIDQNPNLPAGEPAGPLPRNNVVMLADKTGQARLIYLSPDWLLGNLRFIDNGQRLALQLLSPYDPNQPASPQSVRWVALDRSGKLSDLTTSMLGNVDVMGVPNGFVALAQAIPNGDYSQIEYHLVYSVNGQVQEVWNARPGSSAQTWELAWAAPAPTAVNLPPFPTLAR